MASRDAAESPRSAPRRSNAAAAAPKDGGAGVLRPTFRSAAELAGWDEESILLAALVVEDTPVRESRLKRRFSTSAGSAGSNTRKRRSRRDTSAVMPPVVLALDDDDKPDVAADGKKNAKVSENEKPVVVGKKRHLGLARRQIPLASCHVWIGSGKCFLVRFASTSALSQAPHLVGIASA